jgi:hypothetical protein
MGPRPLVGEDAERFVEEDGGVDGRVPSTVMWPPDAGKLADVGAVETFGEAVHPVGVRSAGPSAVKHKALTCPGRTRSRGGSTFREPADEGGNPDYHSSVPGTPSMNLCLAHPSS